MQWLEALIWWLYRTFCNVLEYGGFIALIVFSVVLLLNVSEWILEWEDGEVEDSCD